MKAIFLAKFLLTRGLSTGYQRQLVTLVMLFTATVTFGGESKKLLDKIRENYVSLTSCRSEMAYEIYRGYEAKVPVEQYGGLFCRYEGNTFRRVDRSDFINIEQEGLFIHIDHKYRQIFLSEAIEEQLFETDLQSSLKFCSNITTTKSSVGLLVSLYLNKKTSTLPYTRIDLEVDSGYHIKSMTMYYAAKINFSKDFNRPDFDRVKMKISYIGFDPSWQVENERFDATQYLAASNDTYVPSELYKNYTIVDLRKK